VSRPGILLITLSASLLGLVWASPAAATGYWNLPSTFCQCVGCGFGAGYHAPLVLGPANWDGFCAHNEVRLPCAPSAPYCGNHCGNGGSHFGAPTLLEPAPAQPAPAPVPLTRRPRPLFLR
jgi:hypothetical protein